MIDTLVRKIQHRLLFLVWKPSCDVFFPIVSPKGVWKPRKISNPEYFEDLQPFRMAPFKAVGLELWSMTSDIYFDNFIITSHKEVADRWASDSWGLKKLVASANEVSVMLCKVNGNIEQQHNRHFHCHYMHLIDHRAV